MSTTALESMSQVPAEKRPFGYYFVENAHYYAPRRRRDKCEVRFTFPRENVSLELGFHVVGIEKHGDWLERHGSYGIFVFESGDPFEELAVTEPILSDMELWKLLSRKEAFFAQVRFYGYTIDSSVSVVDRRYEVVAESILQILHPLIFEENVSKAPPMSCGTLAPWWIGFTSDKLEALEERSKIPILPFVRGMSYVRS